MCQKYVKKGYMEMGEQLYLEPWKSVLGRSYLHYLYVNTNLMGNQSWNTYHELVSDIDVEKTCFLM